MTEFREYEPGLYSAGQPSVADIETAAKAEGCGVRTIINLRGADEPVPFDEPGEAARLGLRFVSIPVSGSGDLHASTIERFSRACKAGPC